MILAHAAALTPGTIEGIGSLQGLKNCWFDTSAVTEAGGFEAIIETIGHDRLLYGTDSRQPDARALCYDWRFISLALCRRDGAGRKHIKLQPVLIGLESFLVSSWRCTASS